MAIAEVKVPQLSESVAEATMLTWKKKVGDSVAADEILIEIETDKVVLEVPAPSAGVLSEILVGEGAMVLADQLIARIDTNGKVAASAAVAPAPAASAAAAPAAQRTKRLGFVARLASKPTRWRSGTFSFQLQKLCAGTGTTVRHAKWQHRLHPVLHAF